MRLLVSLLFFALVLVTAPLVPAEETRGKQEAKEEEEEKHPLAGIKLRGIGPAVSSGRITDFAVHPERTNEYFVATASGNLWKTTNAGITWSAVMDEGSDCASLRHLRPARSFRMLMQPALVAQKSSLTWFAQAFRRNAAVVLQKTREWASRAKPPTANTSTAKAVESPAASPVTGRRRLPVYGRLSRCP